MRAVIITLFIVALAGGGLWKLAEGRRVREEQAQAAAAVAAAAALREQRLGLYGEEALGADIAWADTGLGRRTLVEGTGPKPYPGAFVTFSYTVRLKDGTQVDRTEKPTEARIGQMIPGVSAGLQQMHEGGKAVLFVPPKLGYGNRAFGPIPANAGLIFEVELLPR